MALSPVAAVCDRRSALRSRAGFERRYNLCGSVIAYAPITQSWWW